MIELPELVVLKRQIQKTLKGKKINQGNLGNSPHKFVWYNRTHEEFAKLVQGKTIGEPTVKGRWFFIPLLPGYVLTFGEWGGKLLYHEKDSNTPPKYHLLLNFTDGSALSLMIQMWGAVELYKQGEELNRKYVKNMAPDPLNPAFTFSYFQSLIESLLPKGKRSVKSLLTQDQLVPGIGNSILQDILFHAKLHPKYPIQKLNPTQIKILYDTIQTVINQGISQGGRSDETMLYGQPGQYRRILDSQSVGKPCPVCGETIEKSSYLGGACYFCPSCQKV
jgi:formamidopyrimidine-DNA glycosylase